ncbi:MAG: (2Fe-2S) ferredoxin domain-containing protein [Polyangiaceae bacterium]
MPHRERYLFVCTNRRDASNPKGSCAQEGSEELVKSLKEILKKKGLSNRLRACSSSCLDMCEIAAAIVQEPDHVTYGRVKESDLEAIVDAAAAGTVVERLVVRPKAEVASGDGT